ncbi:MAG: hypothetical protein WCH05_06565 [Chlorobiaceae bacterium]
MTLLYLQYFITEKRFRLVPPSRYSTRTADATFCRSSRDRISSIVR